MSSQALTAPNLITSARIALIPTFAWLFLSGKSDVASFWTLAVLGGTDWVDGFLARKMSQVSVLGKVLDPVADRVAVMTVLLVLAFRGTIPGPLAGAILLRDALVSAAFVLLEARGFPRIPVNFTGKAATSAIFAGLGSAVASAAFEGPGTFFKTASVALLGGGAALYWAAALLYLRDVLHLGSIRERHSGPAA